jgi:uncharacterized cupredoxin-like copper-binding protein
LVLFLGVVALVALAGGCTPAPDPEVAVILKDRSFEPAKITIERGKKATLVLQNTASVEHRLLIQRQNIAAPTVPPGQTVRFEVVLPPGTFPIICTVPGHEEDGMVGQITAARKV